MCRFIYNSQYLNDLSESSLEAAEHGMQEAFDDFLSSSLISCHPYGMSDDEVLDKLEQRTKAPVNKYYLMGRIDSLCSKYRIKSIDECKSKIDHTDTLGYLQEIQWYNMVYHRSYYERDSYATSLRVFRANMHPFIDSKNKYLEIDVTSSFNQMTGSIAIEQLYANIGRDVILDYSFLCVDGYGRKACLRMSEIGNPDNIRNQMLLTQAFALNMVIEHPEEVAPGIKGKRFLDGADMELAAHIRDEYLQKLNARYLSTLDEIHLHLGDVPFIGW